MFYKIVGVLKNVANFAGAYLCRDDVNVKVWFYAFRLHIYYKREFSTRLFSSEFRRIFKNTPGRVLLTLNETNT